LSTANGLRADYRCCEAEASARLCALRPKPVRCRKLRTVVEAKLEEHWSPQQIADWLPTAAFPDDPEMRVSHETIYVSPLSGDGGLCHELFRNLPQGQAIRRPQG
jgi:IS30 family transposase